MLNYEREFVGRKNELDQLKQYLDNPFVRVICIHGDTGVGKTALANVLLESYSFDGDLRKEKHSAFRHGHIVSQSNNPQDELLDWFVSSLASKFLDVISRNATRKELERGINTYITNNLTFLLLDNVEDLEQDWLDGFVSEWIDAKSKSKLILTTRNREPFSYEKSRGIEYKELHGFIDNEAKSILALLGDELNKKIPRDLLLENSNKLGNHPQKLLYLRWLNPSENELDHIIDSILNEDKEVLEVVQERIDGPLTHFFALGRNRTIEIEESLFAWLWDNLGNGLASKYIDIRDQLIREGILSSFGADDERGFRINPGVHIQLEKYLEQIVGAGHISHIDYFLAEYYRQHFLSKDDQHDMAKLDSYTYHAIQSGNLVGALDFVLDSGLIKSVHKQGLAFGLSVVLQTFDTVMTNKILEIDKEIARLDRWASHRERELVNEQKKIKKYHARVKIELSHCHKDLSDHHKCLDCLNEAEAIMDAFDDEASRAQLVKSLYYFRGISYSSLGLPEDCIKAYMFVVADGIDRGEYHDEKVLLSLGYLAFERRFFDSSMAVKIGRHAVRLAENNNQLSLISKNLCSLGQSLFFDNKIDEASDSFDRAEKLLKEVTVGSPDRREIGRINLNQAMVKIAANDFDGALAFLDHAEKINDESGDRRRLATARALRGIALFKRGEMEAGKKILDDAIKQHYVLRDWRNLVNEVLSFAYFINYRNKGEAEEAAKRSEHSAEAWAICLNDEASCAPMELFGDYWTSFYRPRILE